MNNINVEWEKFGFNFVNIQIVALAAHHWPAASQKSSQNSNDTQIDAK